MPSKIKVFPLRVAEDLRKHLEALAALQGVSLNAFLSFALETFVASNPLDSKKRALSWQVPFVHRNGRCPCGSGDKYRDCHGRRVAKAIDPGRLPVDLAQLRRQSHQADSRNERTAAAVARTFQRQRTVQPQRTVKLGRNDPCPCGSGVKFKRCCWSQTLIAR
jgi:uncharacterized protein YecA (UPF0149 family)